MTKTADVASPSVFWEQAADTYGALLLRGLDPVADWPFPVDRRVVETAGAVYRARPSPFAAFSRALRRQQEQKQQRRRRTRLWFLALGTVLVRCGLAVSSRSSTAR